MAHIQAVNLTISETENYDQMLVKVGYQLQFTQAEIGLVYRLMIELLGEDKSREDISEEPAHQLGDDLLYTFRFGKQEFYKEIVVNIATLIIQETETRTIWRNALDEDPGLQFVAGTPYGVVYLPYTDEIYARVRLFKEARSETVNLLI